MTAEEWVRTFAERAGAAPPDQDLIDEILKLASVAAHSSERKAAPIACWLAAGGDIAEAQRIAESLS